MIEQLLKQAQDIASSLGSREELGGMGAISLKYHPYEHQWLCIADWSSGIAIKGAQFDDIQPAIEDLIKELKIRKEVIKID